MARRTPDEVYAQLLAAGWPAELAVIMTAIAGAESGWRDDAQGDLGLQNAIWGPSFGLFQIRTVRADTGKGTDRDIQRLQSVGEQAEAALSIYQRAGSFAPWSVFQSGAYQRFLPEAEAAAARVGSSTSGGDDGSGLPSWLPWLLAGTPAIIAGDVAGDALDQGASAVLTGARHIAIEAVVALAGLALVGLGLWLSTSRARRSARRAVVGV